MVMGMLWAIKDAPHGDVGDTFGHRPVNRGLGGNHRNGQNALRTTVGNRHGDNACDWVVSPPDNKGATNVK